MQLQIIKIKDIQTYYPQSALQNLNKIIKINNKVKETLQEIRELYKI